MSGDDIDAIHKAMHQGAKPWTPGPWTASYSKAKAGWTVMHRVKPENNLRGGYFIVAEPQRGADARLIALAPEMVKVLEAIVESDDPMYSSPHVSELKVDIPKDGYPRQWLVNVCHELLARARGEA